MGQRLLAVGFFGTLALILVLALLSVAFGAAPEFPFSNSQQFSAEIPNYTYTGGRSFTCGNVKTGVRFLHFSGPGAWVVFSGFNGKFVAAWIDDRAANVAGDASAHLVIGTENRESGKLTVTSSRPRDPAIDTSPCQIINATET